MKIIDISAPLSPAGVVWPGAPKTEFSWRRSMGRGDRNNNSNLLMNAHTGTHIDAPLHFFKDGEPVEKIHLSVLVGPAHVLEIENPKEITPGDLEKNWPREKVDRVLFKTPNSILWEKYPSDFVKDYCALTEEGARWLLEKKVSLIGVDYLSVQRFGDSPIVHQLLLEAKVVLLEGLNLSAAAPGKYELTCLPLKLEGIEAAPARAILREL